MEIMSIPSTMEEQESGTVIKRLSVPIGLEELMSGLAKEVLHKQPQDIYTFASEHFARLLVLRDETSQIQRFVSAKFAHTTTNKSLVENKKTLSRQLSVCETYKNPTKKIQNKNNVDKNGKTKKRRSLRNKTNLIPVKENSSKHGWKDKSNSQESNKKESLHKNKNTNENKTVPVVLNTEISSINKDIIISAMQVPISENLNISKELKDTMNILPKNNNTMENIKKEEGTTFDKNKQKDETEMQNFQHEVDLSALTEKHGLQHSSELHDMLLLSVVDDSVNEYRKLPIVGESQCDLPITDIAATKIQSLWRGHTVRKQKFEIKVKDNGNKKDTLRKSKSLSDVKSNKTLPLVRSTSVTDSVISKTLDEDEEKLQSIEGIGSVQDHSEDLGIDSEKCSIDLKEKTNLILSDEECNTSEIYDVVVVEEELKPDITAFTLNENITDNNQIFDTVVAVNTSKMHDIVVIEEELKPQSAAFILNENMPDNQRHDTAVAEKHSELETNVCIAINQDMINTRKMHDNVVIEEKLKPETAAFTFKKNMTDNNQIHDKLVEKQSESENIGITINQNMFNTSEMHDAVVAEIELKPKSFVFTLNENTSNNNQIEETVVAENRTEFENVSLAINQNVQRNQIHDTVDAEAKSKFNNDLNHCHTMNKEDAPTEFVSTENRALTNISESYDTLIETKTLDSIKSNNNLSKIQKNVELISENLEQTSDEVVKLLEISGSDVIKITATDTNSGMNTPTELNVPIHLSDNTLKTKKIKIVEENLLKTDSLSRSSNMHDTFVVNNDIDKLATVETNAKLKNCTLLDHSTEVHNALLCNIVPLENFIEENVKNNSLNINNKETTKKCKNEILTIDIKTQPPQKEKLTNIADMTSNICLPDNDLSHTINLDFRDEKLSTLEIQNKLNHSNKQLQPQLEEARKLAKNLLKNTKPIDADDVNKNDNVVQENLTSTNFDNSQLSIELEKTEIVSQNSFDLQALCVFDTHMKDDKDAITILQYDASMLHSEISKVYEEDTNLTSGDTKIICPADQEKLIKINFDELKDSQSTYYLTSSSIVLDQQLALAAPSVLKKEQTESVSPEYIYIPLKDPVPTMGLDNLNINYIEDKNCEKLQNPLLKETQSLEEVSDSVTESVHIINELQQDCDCVETSVMSSRTRSTNEGPVEKVLGNVIDQQLAITVPTLTIQNVDFNDKVEEPKYIYIPLKDPNDKNINSDAVGDNTYDFISNSSSSGTFKSPSSNISSVSVELNNNKINNDVYKTKKSFDISKLRLELEEASKLPNYDKENNQDHDLSDDTILRLNSGIENINDNSKSSLRSNQLYTYEYQQTVHTRDESNPMRDIATIIQTTQISDDGLPLAIQLNQGPGQVFIIIDCNLE
ncbi:hypothetical protein RN001_001521 [Aquatica leii]|uniref:RIIa domain-containing protein n=1 Tax=Aquatica leii TaxID=1421715 RepID=A0AAN7PBQ5_9COLE|nr:hypothetical protein RN001_001521 [Aquatica leii]